VAIKPLPRAALVILAWLLYIASWPLGHGSIINDIYAVAAFGPLLLGAWQYGLRGAVLSVSAFFPIQIWLFLASDHRWGWDMLAGQSGAVGLVVMAIVTICAGVTSTSYRRMQRALQSQADLVAAVSHEVRTPLTAVVGLARELQDSWDTLPDEVRRELVGLVAEQAVDMTAIVEDLLTAAKADQGQLTIEASTTDLSEVAESVVEQLRLDSPVRGHAVAWADPGRTRQVIRNLVVNAARYGGPKVELSAGTNGSMAWLDVTDDGKGVAPEREQALFRPFAAHDRRADSHGLGLALSRQLAVLMGGDLTYTRSNGRTVFRFTLPKAVALEPMVGRLS
jgi:signal transduction histidine kinase